MGEVAFLLFSLLRQNVTFVSVLTLDFTGSGKRETLFSTGVRFYLWHFVINIKLLIIRPTGSRAHTAPVKGKPSGGFYVVVMKRCAILYRLASDIPS